MKKVKPLRFLVVMTLLGLLAHSACFAAAPPPACSTTASPLNTHAPTCPAPAAPGGMTPAAAVGQLIFADVALSASGQQSCATCHASSAGGTAPNNLPVQFGGASLNLQGLRNVPAVMYASYIPGFTLIGTANSSTNPLKAKGGIMRDGRLTTLALQAQQPFITSFEMANANSAQVLARLKTRPYLNQFTAVFGTVVLGSADATLTALGSALAAFEVENPAFHPYTSKYDASLTGQATLSAQEAAGLAAFTDPNRGHCASCHSTQPLPGGAPAQFTDYTFHNEGIPRNWAIAYNNDALGLPSYVPQNGLALGAPNHHYYDLGLCGPLRTDLAVDTTLCGQFKMPTLRNVGLKQTYMHNGVFSSLQDVVAFYATRNSNPARWYKTATGAADILYNDLPQAYAANVAPVGHPGKPIAPNLNPTDVQNIVSFLCTLTDGYNPANAAAYNATGQCKGL